ncbi:tyrosine-type recombinase/integrase [Natronococcus sp. A-GB1]|uniref:tyrosine-type recombinase/integrase n=1 Tax=Natronococcus sp. A-GB1 TaxID=3037648 RepID=UPI00241C4E63|nr:tyrosine-type recombinase/integrase [Natronococcus sp. A-GB1]MDG5759392.1 tyrosine-type recombinase/integrase [Natronococcus sp. A-GB1]
MSLASTRRLRPMDSHIERHLDRVKGMKSEGTFKRRRVDLRDYNEWLEDQGYGDCASLDWLQIESYLLEQNSKGYAPSTVASKYQSLRELYDFLTDIDEYDDSPFEKLSRKDYVNGNSSKKFDESEVIYVTPEDVELMTENVPKPTLRNELIIRLMFQTGVRRSELVSIELEDINREERSIEIWSQKTQSSRTVFYQPSLDLLMEQWIDGGYRDSYLAAAESDHLFLGQKGELKKDRLGNIIKEAAENADIQEVMYEDQQGRKRYRITCHALRHGHAVHALKSGIDIRNLQKHMGHADIERTSEYLQLINDDVREAFRQFGVTDD